MTRDLAAILVALDFYGDTGHHAPGPLSGATIPGYAAAQREHEKFEPG